MIKKNRINKIDFILILLSIMVFIISFYLAINDNIFLGQFNNSSDKIQVASVANINNEVKRKMQGNLSWFPLSQSDKIYLSDSIFTDKASDAEISFKDGSKLFIESSSLITINESQIDVQQGSLSGQLGEKGSLKLKFKDKVQELQGKNSQVKIEMDENGQSKITVLDGQVQLKSDGVDQILLKNQMIKIGIDGELSNIENLPIELISPRARSKFWMTNRNGSLEFKWNSKEEVEKYIFELNTDPTFSTPMIKKELIGHSAIVKNLPLDKTYYWRVIGITTSDMLLGPIYSLQLFTERPPSLLTPPQAANILLPKNKDTVTLNLSWADNSGGSEYLLQMAQDAQFKNLIFEKKLKEKSVESVPLKKNQYFWRVKVLNDEQRKNSKWSMTSIFEVNTVFNSNSLSISANQLPPPINKTSMLLKDPGLIPHLSWSKIKGADDYLIQWSAKPDFKNIIDQIQTKNNFYDFDQGKPQTYYWRVAGIAEQVYLGRWSQIQKFALMAPLSSPQLLTPTEEKSYFTQSKIHFNWKLESGLNPSSPESQFQFQIQIADNLLFKNPILSKNLNQTKFTLALKKPGNYFWRIRSLKYYQYKNSTGLVENIIERASLFTKIRKLNVIETLQPPQLATTNSIFYLNQKKELLWKVNSNNSNQNYKDKNYFVQIALNPKFSNAHIINQMNLKQNKMNLNLSTIGKYFWRVRRTDDNNITSPFSEVGTIMIYPPMTAPIPVERLVKVGASQEAIISWSKVAGHKSYEVLLSSKKSSLLDQNVLNSATNLDQLSIKKFLITPPAQNLKVKFDQSGTFYWRVRAKLQNNINGPNSVLAVIKVYNELPPPLLLSEKEKYIVPSNNKTTEYLEWTKVNGATSYEIELSTDSKFTTPIKKYSSKTILGFPPQMQSNRYFWRVASVGFEGKAGPFSLSRTFNFVKKLKAPVPLVIKSKNPQYISWSKIKTAKNYLLEITKNQTSFVGNHFKLKVNEQSFDLKSIKKGTYYWRVSAVDKEDNEGDYSKTERFQMLESGTVVHCADESDLLKTDLDKIYFDEKNDCIIIILGN